MFISVGRSIYGDDIVTRLKITEGHPVAEGSLTAEAGLSALRAISEPTRLRILMLLTSGELTVKDCTQILGQSQPRISRHLKLMHDAGLLTRAQEGSWVYFRLTDASHLRELLVLLLAQFNSSDGEFRRDSERANAIRQERFDRAQAFFADHAGQWDELRALHADEREVEARICKLLTMESDGLLVDAGTGTGRILELLSNKFRQAVGVDTNQHMLAYARARTQGPDFSHVQVRQGDICNLTLSDGSADVVIMHQVLHYLAAPQRAIAEAARVLKSSGQLLIVDFAAHTVDRLRDDFAHQRLGFSGEQMSMWLSEAGLSLQRQEELPPKSHAATDGLTVTFWLAKPAPIQSAERADGNSLEIIQ
jgi:ubiquinone/menaquinone biosynthesis C-methylase UbiE/DNA-binding transcriptional ArsR family regulator